MSKIEKSVAEQEFDRFARFARIKLTRSRNANTQRDLEEDRQSFIDLVMDGIVQVDEDGLPTVITECEHLQEIKFTKRPTVLALRAMDKAKESQQNGKMILAMADTLGIATAMFNKLDYVDFDNVSLVFSLFLAN